MCAVSLCSKRQSDKLAFKSFYAVKLKTHNCIVFTMFFNPKYYIFFSNSQPRFILKNIPKISEILASVFL